MIATASLVLLLLVPGLVTIAALGPGLPRKTKLDLLEGVSLALLIGVVVIGWAGFVLAELGVYSLPRLALIAVGYPAALVVLRRHHLTFPVRGWPAQWRDLALITCLLIVTAVLYLRPFEYILGGLDPGVYMNTGVNIARTGSILIKDGDVAAFSQDEWAVLFGERASPWIVASRQPGFNLRDYSGTVEPHGFHLFPTWIAILYSLGGLGFAFYTAPIFAVMGVFALYCLARRLFNSWIGLVAALLLATNAVSMWFGRYPAAEMLTQYLFLAGIWAFLVMLEAPSKPMAALAGFALGLVHLAKIELFFIPVVVLLYLAALWLGHGLRREHLYFLVSYLFVLAYAFLHASLIATGYAMTVVFFSAPSLLYGESVVTRGLQSHAAMLFSVLVLLRWKIVAGVLLVSTALTVILGRYRSPIQSTLARIGRHERMLGVLVASALMASLAYGYYIRPILGTLSDSPLPLGPLQSGDTGSMVKMAMLISPMGLLLTGVGLFLILTEGRRKGIYLILGIGLVQTLILLYNGFITPVYFWAARRDLPVFLPLAAMCIAYALWAFRHRATGALRWIAPAALGVVVLAPQVRASAPFVGHFEYGGAIQKTAQFAALFPDRAVVLWEWSVDSFRYAAPLQYLYGKTSFVVPNASAQDPRLATLVSRWQQEGRPVFWITTLQEAQMKLPDQKTVLQGTYASVLPEAESPVDRVPSKVGEWVAVYDIYQVMPGTAVPGRTLASVDVSRIDDEGFYPRDNPLDNSAPRWTKGSAEIRVPGATGSDLALQLNISGGRPSFVPSGQTSVSLNGEHLADLVLTNRLHTYVVSIPPELQKPGVWTIHFETTTWNPALTGASGENRDLGMLVQSIVVEGN